MHRLYIECFTLPTEKNGDSVLQMSYFSPLCLKSWRLRMGSRLGQCILSYQTTFSYFTSQVKSLNAYE